jgi:hypothetical protein
MDSEAFHVKTVGGELVAEDGCLAAEFGADAGAEAAECAALVGGALEFGEEVCDAVGDDLGGAEVEGALAAALAEGDAVVGAEAASGAGAEGSDDRAGDGEKLRLSEDV